LEVKVLAKPRIFVIDDDQDLLAELGTLLESAGYEPALFEDGSKALEALSESPPDIIITDLKMPVMNGFQLANELARRPETARIPVIALTGFFTRQEHLELMRVCGIGARLTKPVAPGEILALVRVFLKERERPVEADGTDAL
jgi:two-component system cell cycle response regulator DivK